MPPARKKPSEAPDVNAAPPLVTLKDRALAAAAEFEEKSAEHRKATMLQVYSKVLGLTPEGVTAYAGGGDFDAPWAIVDDFEFCLETTKMFDRRRPTYEPDLLILRKYRGKPLKTTDTRAKGIRIQSLADLGRAIIEHSGGNQ